MKILLPLFVALSISVFAQNSEIEKGVTLFKAKKFDASYKILKPYADNGDKKAQFYIGLLYDMGTIGMMDKFRAVEWYRKAAEQGYADAQYDMGVMFSKGEGIYKDLKEAYYWYSKAAAQGHGYALYNLGVANERGYGVEKNITKAAQYYRLASDKNISRASYNLGNIFYQNGEYKKAFDYYHKGSILGHPKSQFKLAWMYHQGIATDKNETMALKWYRESAYRGYKKGMINYALMLDKDGKTKEAEYWRERANQER